MSDKNIIASQIPHNQTYWVRNNKVCANQGCEKTKGMTPKQITQAGIPHHGYGYCSDCYNLMKRAGKLPIKNNSQQKESAVPQEVVKVLSELEQIKLESEQQKLPEQKITFKSEAIKTRAKKRGVHNLPDQLNPPMGFDPEKAFDTVFPFVNIPPLNPHTIEDNISFGFPEVESNKIYFGDNLHVLRTLKSNSIDLIYIDPPFFSGRNYNQIWGDDNEVRTFFDIWEDGLPSYLVWLNARLWEMKRILKDTGTIYVHCDWHASHYIKCEMDKIFGYENFLNEVVWHYKTFQGQTHKYFARKHDILFLYKKFDNFIYQEQFDTEFEDTIDSKRWKNYLNEYHQIVGGKMPIQDSRFQRYLKKWIKHHKREPKPDEVVFEIKGQPVDSVWHLKGLDPKSNEKIGYPTQKPEELLERVITVSSKEGDIVADFFMGGGTTLALAQKLNRRFIGCDISRVAVSVTVNRVIMDGEELSGHFANIREEKQDENKETLQSPLFSSKIPDIKVHYLGIYPIEKFNSLSQKQFEDFILRCYGASRFTGEGKITGIMNRATNILIGPVQTTDSIKENDLKDFIIDSLKLRYQSNMKIKLKVLAWTFPPNMQKYSKQLENYFYQKNLPVSIELIPINSQLFRKRILEHYPEADDNEYLLKFVTSPSIAEIRYKKIKELTYEFEAIGARSNNLNGYLINCQWDFDFRNNLFSEPEFSLMRKKAESGPHEGKYIAVLKCEKTFERAGEHHIACRVQDNLGAEVIKSIKIKVE